MLPGLDFVACPNLAVPAQVMRHVVEVESGANPFAIGVVGGQLVRQPRTLAEAVATARMLESAGYNYSVGAAQVNRANLHRYGLDTHEKAFDRCANLAVGAAILANCHASANGDWGKAFSCYYSGNFVTGFRSGYVQKIYDSISRGSTLLAQGEASAAPIPLQPSSGAPVTALGNAAGARMPPHRPAPASAASRVAMRASPFATPHPAEAAAPGAMPAGSTAGTVARPPEAGASVAAATPPAAPGAAMQASPPAPGQPEVFVPQVRMLDAAPTVAAGAFGAATTPPPPARRQDDAFVF